MGRECWVQDRSFGHLGVSENKGTVFWGTYNQDPTIFGNPPFGCLGYRILRGKEFVV